MALKRRQSLLRSETGAELIEFALVAPLLILLLSGIFDFGMMFRTLEAVTNAAREGARVGVLPGYEDEADVLSRVNAYLASSGLDPITDAQLDAPFVPVATSAGTFTARSVTVNYTYQFAILAGVSQIFGGSFGSFPLQAVSVMRTETQAAP